MHTTDSHNINNAPTIAAITTITWFTPAHHGQCFLAASRASQNWCKPAPDLEAPDQALAIIGKPVRYFQRMSAEARYCLCAASMAVNAAGWHETKSSQSTSSIGMLAGRFDGTLTADLAYYQDYLASGRTLARGNMFVYTLPTSVLGSVSVVLGLAGPAFYLDQDHQPLQGLLAQASQLITTKQATAMLIFWSDDNAAVCIAADQPHATFDKAAQTTLAQLLQEEPAGQPPTPLTLAQRLQSHVERT